VSRTSLATPVEPLTDGVVVLRLPHHGDVETVYTYGQDPDIEETRWLPIGVPCSHADAAHLIRQFQRGWRGRFGLTLAIVAPSADKLRGVAHLYVHDSTVGEIAYGIAPQYRRFGLATRAVLLLSNWAVTDLGLTRLEICVTARGVHGLASQRVAEKAGFIYAGMRRSCVPATGMAYEDRLYIFEVSEQ
jgi:RimJ/RimL family protein N-acetyltransferase